MKPLPSLIALILSATFAHVAEKSMFNGKDLTGWKGQPEFWSVKDGHLQQFINGMQTVDVTDESSLGAKKGVIALQLHAGAPMTVQFKDLVLKTDRI